MEIPSVLDAGYHEGCLDITNLNYRWFGAIWGYQDSVRVVCGYWFRDSKEEIIDEIKNSVLHYRIDNTQIDDVYQFIRQEQKRLDWERRSRLPFFVRFKKPWSSFPHGWYVLFSSDQFPLICTCIRKNNVSIWIEHVTVCETKPDVDEFVNKINDYHGIRLKLNSNLSLPSLGNESNYVH